jgi:hypothetical protein
LQETPFVTPSVLECAVSVFLHVRLYSAWYFFVGQDKGNLDNAGFAQRIELNSSASLQDYCCKNGAACIQPVRFLQALATWF